MHNRSCTADRASCSLPRPCRPQTPPPLHNDPASDLYLTHCLFSWIHGRPVHCTSAFASRSGVARTVVVFISALSAVPTRKLSLIFCLIDCTSLPCLFYPLLSNLALQLWVFLLNRMRLSRLVPGMRPERLCSVSLSPKNRAQVPLY